MNDSTPPPEMSAFTRPLTKPQRMTYRIGRGETLVLTFEPYKSEILPLWRFRTPAIARESSRAIFAKFLQYERENDFIGMDMSRKFLQMGMTRAKRYANHKGGRKYRVDGDGEGGGKRKVELEKCEMGEKEREKEECSLIFRGVWERVKACGGYVEGKERFLKEQKEWDREMKKLKKMKKEEEEKVEGDDAKVEEVEDEVNAKSESEGEARRNPKRATRTRVKKEIKEEDSDD
ncbi:hypothetical protein HBI46_195200 [Parastagonospora nodorum]|nr:hypothetical protein HBI71_206930 [Parastagonospora nodorum]KAH5406162.1 hypothetical protein HBI46_195200 [Parastagonospora nodorum]KAH5760884.1 hypothetical protein HBI16_184810 [Parastagonospora nodorum]KAH6100633.1 hypothetical protein HBI69_220410 [Parastagonospora nodorum]